MSIFTKIINGEIPCHKLAENETCFAFLDISPLAKGHVLVVPKVEVDYLFDAPDALLTDLMLFAKHIAVALKRAVPCIRVGVAVIGLEVPHAHIHLIPLNQVSDINFSRPKMQISHKELAEIAEAIRKEL